MRIFGLVFCLLVPIAVQAAKLDKTVYPNANIYLEPASRSASGFAKIIREYCPGGGRGLIHFFGIDGKPIRLEKTWPTYLELAPGVREFEMEFKGTSTGVWGAWQGMGKTSATLEAGKSYVVRYQRLAVDGFRIWIEPNDVVTNVDMHTVFCAQSPFPDASLHQ